MHPRTINRRLTLPLAACGLAAALALPAGAGAAKNYRIDPSADPLAPSGQTPVVLFNVMGLDKGRQYRLYADQVSGESDDTCDTSLGNGSALVRARSSRLTWDTRPDYFVAEPELYQFDYRSFAPCKGMYKGRLQVKGRSGMRTLERFKVTVPGLDLRYLRR